MKVKTIVKFEGLHYLVRSSSTGERTWTEILRCDAAGNHDGESPIYVEYHNGVDRIQHRHIMVERMIPEYARAWNDLHCGNFADGVKVHVRPCSVELYRRAITGQVSGWKPDTIGTVSSVTGSNWAQVLWEGEKHPFTVSLAHLCLAE